MSHQLCNSADIDPLDRTYGPLTPNVPVANHVQMPAINFPPIHIVIETHQIADQDWEAGPAGEAGREVETDDEESGRKWDFELNLNNLPEKITIEGEVSGEKRFYVPPATIRNVIARPTNRRYVPCCTGSTEFQ
jgi:hypothetical protein